MIPDNSQPKPPPVESWEAGADDRDLDKYFNWKFYTDAEDRSLDRMIEMMRRDTAAVRAVLKIKERLLGAGIWVRPTSRELFLLAHDWRTWAETERDANKGARLRKHGDRCEALARSAQRREVDARAKRPTRKRRPPA
jgi:hypothetical protein